MRKILKCISTTDKFDAGLFSRLNLGVEIQDFTEPNLSLEEKTEILNNYQRLFNGYNGVKSVHGPFLDLKPASPDLLIREVSYQRYLDVFQIATQLNTDYLIFHSQINPFLVEPLIRNLNNRQAKEFWNEILQETDYRGLILIENVFEDTPDMLLQYIQTVNLPNIKVNLDIGHLKARKGSLEGWIKKLRDYIEYIHVHSNNGLYDLHRSPADKEITSLFNLLASYNLNPAIALEYEFSNIEEEIARYRQV